VPGNKKITPVEILGFFFEFLYLNYHLEIMPQTDASTSIEGGITSPVEGYPKLACYMGTYHEAAIFRRFGSLNSQNLLYLQAELVHLERELRRLESLDSIAQRGSDSVYATDWYWLDNSGLRENCPQLKVVLAIRSKLKEYS
jgi:hypothetical protein